MKYQHDKEMGQECSREERGQYLYGHNQIWCVCMCIWKRGESNEAPSCKIRKTLKTGIVIWEAEEQAWGAFFNISLENISLDVGLLNMWNVQNAKKLNNYATYISGAGKDRRWKDIIGQGKILIGPVFRFVGQSWNLERKKWPERLCVCGTRKHEVKARF